MKLSLFTFPEHTDTSPYAALCDLCLSLGIKGLEGWETAYLDSVEKAKELRRILDGHGMVCPCFSQCSDLLSEHWQKDVENLKLLSEMAAVLGAPYLHHTLVPDLSPRSYTEEEFEAALQTLLPRAMAVREAARAQGIDVIYEEQGFLVNGAKRFARFLEALAPEEAHVCADLGNNYFMDEPPELYLSAVLPRVRHVHLKDYLVSDARILPGSLPSLSGKYLTHVVCGEGFIDYPKCFSMLQKSGYDGWYSLELGADPENIRKNAESIRRLAETV